MEQQKSRFSLNAFQIKVFALVFYIAGKSLIQISYLHLEGETFSSLLWTVLFIAGNFMHLMAVPMIALLTVEAVMKTRNLRQYFTRLGFAAVLTEILLDLAAYGGKCFDFSHGFLENPAFKADLNFYFTLIIGSVAVVLMDRVINKRFRAGSVPYVLLNVLVILVSCFLAQVPAGLRCEQGGLGVLMMCAVYFFYGNPLITLIVIAVLQVIALGSNFLLVLAPILGGLTILFYNGNEGRKTGLIRLVTYIAYPICYGILIFVLGIVGGRT